MAKAFAISLDVVRDEQAGQLAQFAAAAADGDECAFSGLYDLLSQRIFNFVLRSVRDYPTAEELCQEIWFRAHQEIPTLRSPEAIRSWLYRIASRTCVDFARSQRGRHRREEEGVTEHIQASGPDPEEIAITGREVRLVWETLGSMAPRQSMALYLRQVDGLTYAEIGSILGCSVPVVEALLFRARQSFARAYQRVESSPSERCEMFTEVMARVIDHEPTEIQSSALEAHTFDCRRCRAELAEMRRGNRAYGSLPLLPAGKGLALDALVAGGAAGGGAGLLPSAAGLLGIYVLQAKTAVIATTLVVAAVAAGGASVSPGREDFAGGSNPVVHASVAESESGPALLPNPYQDSAQTTLNLEPDEHASPSSMAIADSPKDASPSITAIADSSESGATRSPGPDLPEHETTAGGDKAGAVGSSSAENEATAGPVGEPIKDEPFTPLQQTAGDIATHAGDTVPDAVTPPGAVIPPLEQASTKVANVSPGEAIVTVPTLLPESGEVGTQLDETASDVTEPAGHLPQNPPDDVATHAGDTVPDAVTQAEAVIQSLEQTSTSEADVSGSERIEDVPTLGPESDEVETQLNETVNDVTEAAGELP